MTIYSVKKRISEFFGAYTRPSHGTIHPSLKKMLAENFVSVREILSEGGKKSSYYSITDKGKKFFTSIMLEDFSENPSVFLNEMNIRIAAMGALNKENRQALIAKCLKSLELYTAKTERQINDEYSDLDYYQKNIMSFGKNQSLAMIDFLMNIKV